MFEKIAMLNEMLHTFKKQKALDLAYKAKADDYVISIGTSALKILESHSDTKHSYNLAGLGADATSFTKAKAQELIKKWNIAGAKPVKKSTFIKEHLDMLESGIASVQQMLDAENEKGAQDTSSVVFAASALTDSDLLYAATFVNVASIESGMNEKQPWNAKALKNIKDPNLRVALASVYLKPHFIDYKVFPVLETEIKRRWRAKNSLGFMDSSSFAYPDALLRASKVKPTKTLKTYIERATALIRKFEKDSGIPDESSVMGVLAALASNDKQKAIVHAGNNVSVKSDSSVIISHASGSTISIDTNGNVTLNGGEIEMSSSSPKEEDEKILPAGVILSTTVENIRLGKATTTAEMSSVLNRLAHADISATEIASRFSKAFSDVLVSGE